MRQTAQRYVPPSRRRAGGELGEAETEARGLEGAAQAVSQVRLIVLQDGLSFDTATCPLDIEAAQGASGGSNISSGDRDPTGAAGGSSSPAVDAGIGGVSVRSAPGQSGSSGTPNNNSGNRSSYMIFFPERLPSELLRWLGDTFPGGAARLEFPPSLSKAERARWHHAAERLRLHGESVGIGEGRYLTICTAPPSAGGGGAAGGAAAGSGPRLQLTREQKERARFIWNCAQMEGGKHWERSQGEVEALVASGQPLPDDLQALVDKRLRGEEVLRLLKMGHPSEALSLLSEDPKLAWIKDAQTGGYPIHVAAFKGYESVVLFLASLPGVLEQRDGRRDTALGVARRRHHSSIEELLLEAGVDPAKAGFEQEAAPHAGSDSSGRTWTAGRGEAQGEEAEEEYNSWSAEERLRYRHGGTGRGGPPPGLHHRGSGPGSRGRGRAGWDPGPGRGTSARGEAGQGGVEGQRALEQQQQQHCPW